MGSPTRSPARENVAREVLRQASVGSGLVLSSVAVSFSGASVAAIAPPAFRSARPIGRVPSRGRASGTSADGGTRDRAGLGDGQGAAGAEANGASAPGSGMVSVSGLMMSRRRPRNRSYAAWSGTRCLHSSARDVEVR